MGDGLHKNSFIVYIICIKKKSTDKMIKLVSWTIQYNISFLMNLIRFLLVKILFLFIIFIDDNYLFHFFVISTMILSTIEIYSLVLKQLFLAKYLKWLLFIGGEIIIKIHSQFRSQFDLILKGLLVCNEKLLFFYEKFLWEYNFLSFLLFQKILTKIYIKYKYQLKKMKNTNYML